MASSYISNTDNGFGLNSTPTSTAAARRTSRPDSPNPQRLSRPPQPPRPQPPRPQPPRPQYTLALDTPYIYQTPPPARRRPLHDRVPGAPRAPRVPRNSVFSEWDITRVQLARPQSPDDYTVSSASAESLAYAARSYDDNSSDAPSTVGYNDDPPPRLVQAIPPFKTSCNDRRDGIYKSDTKVSESLTKVIDDCPLCLEKLVSVFNEDIGVTVPCGHCFHWKCFQESKTRWRANKCPTCREPTSDFIRVFITTNFNKDSSDLEEEAVQSLRKSIAQIDTLKKEMVALEEELEKIKKEAEAQEQHLNTMPKFMKDMGDNIQRIGNGLHYIYFCIKKGCIRGQDEDEIDRLPAHIYSIDDIYPIDGLDDFSGDFTPSHEDEELSVHSHEELSVHSAPLPGFTG